MVTYSEWRDDSVPFWTTCGTRNTTQPGWRWNSYADNPTETWDADPLMADSWAGTGTIDGPDAGAGYSMLNVEWNDDDGKGGVWGSRSAWYQFWLTVDRYDPLISSGILPASVYDSGTGTFTDPNVVGVEWGAPGPALAQRLQVVMRSGWKHPVDQPVYVKSNSLAQPPFTTGASVAALPNLGIIPAGSGSLTIASPPVANQGADKLTVGLVDAYTQAQALPPLPPGERLTIDIDLPCNLTLEGQFAPPYRLIYGAPVAAQPPLAPLRVLQRGNDGVGLGGGKRVLGARTMQATNRRGRAIR